MKFNGSLITNSITEAWEKWFEELCSQNDNAASRDGDVVGEVINAITVIRDPRNNVLDSEQRKLSMKYAIGEYLWYTSCSTKLKEIQKYTNGWDRMSDDGCNVNSNYGHCIRQKFGFDQWEYVKQLLTTQPHTRQAVIHIKEPSCELSKDVNCTIALQFFIRDEWPEDSSAKVPRLHMTTFMRSNDIWMGFPYDIFNFCNFQVLMSMELGVALGAYTHIAGSLHLYKRDLDKYLTLMAPLDKGSEPNA